MKHAILIIAHDSREILYKTLEIMDSENHDFFIHLDKELMNLKFDDLNKHVRKSSIYIVPHINVKWGSYSLIQCEMILFKEAYKKQKYDYYHLISGVDLPLKNNFEFDKIFENNNGKNFMHFTSIQKNELVEERIKYYHIEDFSCGISNKLLSKILKRIFLLLDKFYVKFQKLIKINRTGNFNGTIVKGSEWVSVTNEFVRYLLKQKDRINKTMIHTFCADEVYKHTLLWNSEFRDTLYKIDKNDDHKTALRMIKWCGDKKRPYTWKIDDYEELMQSECVFARKFNQNVDSAIIQKIYDNCKEK